MSAASLHITSADDSFAVEVLPERGLDIGAVRFRGHRLDWHTPGDLPIDSPQAPDQTSLWERSFTGGLMVTCGLHNVGIPSEGHDLHGAFSATPASDVRLMPAPEATRTVVTGTVRDGDLECQRRIDIDVKAASIRVHDVVTNHGSHALQAPILYHVNWGAPLLDEATTVATGSARVTPRDAASGVICGDWSSPTTVGTGNEVVIEHLPSSASAGLACATIANPVIGINAVVSWRGLSRLHQWIDLRPGRFVTSLEPANCSVRGRSADRRDGTAPFLKSGDARVTSISIELEYV